MLISLRKMEMFHIVMLVYQFTRGSPCIYAMEAQRSGCIQEAGSCSGLRWPSAPHCGHVRRVAKRWARRAGSLAVGPKLNSPHQNDCYTPVNCVLSINQLPQCPSILSIPQVSVFVRQMLYVDSPMEIGATWSMSKMDRVNLCTQNVSKSTEPTCPLSRNQTDKPRFLLTKDIVPTSASFSHEVKGLYFLSFDTSTAMENHLHINISFRTCNNHF